MHGSSPLHRDYQPGQTARLSDCFPGSLRRRRAASRAPDHSCSRRNRATFTANATLKAVYYSRFAPGELVLADDSGLEVDALHGAPGVRSARFAADAGLVDSPDANDNSDVWNNMVLLQRLAGVAAPRIARYRCVLVAARDGLPCHTAHGTVEGLILEAPRGTGGFGYDPLFYLPTLGCTMAEIDLETKLSFSHRGRAFETLLGILRR